MAAEFEDVAWIAFCKRLEAAIKQAGLPGRFASQLAGTFVEMVSNLVEHSERPEMGIVGYKWKQGEFEYVVADNGIGLLNSLKTHRDYAALVDAGQALEPV
jgi:anti-sigma regulatory factor (Ser/Thr protein kinase)